MPQNSKIMEKLEIDDITTEGNIRWGLVKSVASQFSLHSVLILRIRFSCSSSFSTIVDEGGARKSTDYRSQLCLSWGLAAIIWLAVGGLGRTSVEPTLLLKINRSHLRDPTPRIFFAVERAITSLDYRWFAFEKRRTNQIWRARIIMHRDLSTGIRDESHGTPH